MVVSWTRVPEWEQSKTFRSKDVYFDELQVKAQWNLRVLFTITFFILGRQDVVKVAGHPLTD